MLCPSERCRGADPAGRAQAGHGQPLSGTRAEVEQHR